MKKILYITVIGLLLTALAGCGQTSSEKSVDSSNISEDVKEVVIEGNLSSMEEENKKPAEVKSVTISATGDCTLGRAQIHGYSGSFDDYYDKYGESYFFQGVKEIFEADDFTLINLECVLTNADKRVEKTYNLKGDPSYTGILTSSSVEGCSFGNNHNYDYGQQSYDDTINALKDAGLSYAVNEQIGTYKTEEGITIGFVSTSLLSGAPERMAYLTDGISRLKEEGADLIIACCHWGVEGEHYANADQVSKAHALIDAGCDLVIGNHPHVLQGIECYKGKMICYSLGNFSFGGNSNPKDKQDGIFTQTFTFVDGKLDESASLDARFIPCTLSGHSNYNDFCPQIATDQTKESILSNMAEYSASYSQLSFDEDGNISVSEE